MMGCCSTRKKTFTFENGTRVSAQTLDEAISKLKRTRRIMSSEFLKEKNNWLVEFDSGAVIECDTPRVGEWNMYLDKREPVCLFTGGR